MSTHSIKIRFKDVTTVSRIRSCNETGFPEEGCCTVVTGIVNGIQHEVPFDCLYPPGPGLDDAAYMVTPKPGRAPTGQGKRLYVAAVFLPILGALKEGDYEGAIELIRALPK